MKRDIKEMTEAEKRIYLGFLEESFGVNFKPRELTSFEKRWNALERHNPSDKKNKLLFSKQDLTEDEIFNQLLMFATTDYLEVLVDILKDTRIETLKIYLDRIRKKSQKVIDSL